MTIDHDKIMFTLGYSRFGIERRKNQEIDNKYPRGSMEWRGFQMALNDYTLGKYDIRKATENFKGGLRCVK